MVTRQAVLLYLCYCIYTLVDSEDTGCRQEDSLSRVLGRHSCGAGSSMFPPSPCQSLSQPKTSSWAPPFHPAKAWIAGGGRQQVSPPAPGPDSPPAARKSRNGESETAAPFNVPTRAGTPTHTPHTPILQRPAERVGHTQGLLLPCYSQLPGLDRALFRKSERFLPYCANTSAWAPPGPELGRAMLQGQKRWALSSGGGLSIFPAACKYGA
jgi:hypothetical protein